MRVWWIWTTAISGPGEDTVTSAPGIFAAGDVRTKPLRQIITAAADGANAITSVERYLVEN